MLNKFNSKEFFVKDISMLKEAMVAPLLPWILTLQIYIFGESWFNIFIFNSFFGALFPIALFWGLKPYFSKLPAAPIFFHIGN